MPFPKAVYWQALTVCLNRFTDVGTAALLRVSLQEVQFWRRGQRTPRPNNQAAIIWLARVSTKAIEDLEDEILTGITVDQPVKTPKRTLPVVVSDDYSI